MKDFLSKIHNVENHILDEYISHWEEYNVAKKTIMIQPGKTERYLYYVISGIQKAYYLKDDKQHIIIFSYPPSFCGVPESFLSQTPSKYFLETITDSKFLRISFEKHQELMEKYRSIETMFRKSVEMLLIGVLQRYYELMAFDMQTRFNSFSTRSPHLFQILSQKDISSYLKIDPTNFSKLMNNSLI